MVRASHPCRRRATAPWAGSRQETGMRENSRDVAERPVADAEIEAFRHDGVVCLRRLLDTEWVARMRAAVDRATEHPGPMRETYHADQPGVFFSEKFLWDRGCGLPGVCAELAGGGDRRPADGFEEDLPLLRSPPGQRGQHPHAYPLAPGFELLALGGSTDLHRLVPHGPGHAQERDAGIRPRLPPLARRAHEPGLALRSQGRRTGGQHRSGCPARRRGPAPAGRGEPTPRVRYRGLGTWTRATCWCSPP